MTLFLPLLPKESHHMEPQLPSAQTRKLPTSAAILSIFPQLHKRGPALCYFNPFIWAFFFFFFLLYPRLSQNISIINYSLLFPTPIVSSQRNHSNQDSDSTSPWPIAWPSTPSSAFEPLISVTSIIPSPLQVKTWVIHEFFPSLAPWIQSVPKPCQHCFLKVPRTSAFHNPSRHTLI